MARQRLAFLQSLDLSDCRYTTDQTLVYLKKRTEFKAVMFPKNSEIAREGLVSCENTAKLKSCVMPIEVYIMLHPDKFSENDIIG